MSQGTAWDGKATIEAEVFGVTERKDSRTLILRREGENGPWGDFTLHIERGDDFRPGDKVRVTVELIQKEAEFNELPPEEETE